MLILLWPAPPFVSFRCVNGLDKEGSESKLNNSLKIFFFFFFLGNGNSYLDFNLE